MFAWKEALSVVWLCEDIASAAAGTQQRLSESVCHFVNKQDSFPGSYQKKLSVFILWIDAERIMHFLVGPI